VSVASGFTSTRRTDYGFAKKLGNTITLTSAVKVYDTSNTYVETLPINTVLYAIQAGPGVASGCFLFTSTILYVDLQYYNSIGTLHGSCSDIYTLPSFGRKLYTAPVSSLTNYMYFDLSTPYQDFTINDKISFELKIGSGGFSTNNFTASLEKFDSSTGYGSLSNQLVTNQIGSNPYAENITVPFISGSTNIGTTRNNTLILSEELSYFLNYQYLPSGSGFTQNSQYNRYGDVNFTFSPKSGDVILIYYGSNNYFEGNIASVFKSEIDNKVYIVLSSELPSSLARPAYVSNTVSKFVFLDRKPDENNLILNFDKKPGDTSLGFIIPNNLHPDMLDNIDVITKEVKQKLIDLGSSDMGGAF
jgi:hypothetical protein